MVPSHSSRRQPTKAKMAGRHGQLDGDGQGVTGAVVQLPRLAEPALAVVGHVGVPIELVNDFAT